MTQAVDLEGLLAELDAARSALLVALNGLTEGELSPRPRDAQATAPTLLDVLWRRGARDDWTRLVIDQALDGRPTSEWAPRTRPSYVETSDLIVAWLTQTRGALLARVRRLASTELDRSLALSDGPASPRTLLSDAMRLDANLSSQLIGRDSRGPRASGARGGRA